MAVTSISSIPSPAQIYRENVAAQKGLTETTPTQSFGSIFNSLVQEANTQYETAEAGTQALLSGETDDVAQVMIDSTKAETALNMVIQVRNKILDAYNEVMRMAL